MIREYIKQLKIYISFLDNKELDELLASDQAMQESIQKVLFGMHAGLRHPRSERHAIIGDDDVAEVARYFKESNEKDRAMKFYFNIAVNEIPDEDKHILEDIPGKEGKLKIKNCDRFFELIRNEYDMISFRIGQYEDHIEGTQAQASLSQSYDRYVAQRQLTAALEMELSALKSGGKYSDFTIENGSICLLKKGQIWLNISMDMPLMMQINWWPVVAEEWKTRDRAWPSEDVIKRLTESCYVTRTSSDDNPFEFSYSFSNVQRELTKKMSYGQKVIYFLFKALIYKYINPIDPANIPTTLEKTIMLFAIEFRDPEDSMWNDENFALKYLLSEYVKAIEDGKLPNYFIPTVNIITELQDDKKVQVCKKLYEMINNAATFLNKLPLNDAVIFYNDVASACQEIAVILQRIKSLGQYILKSLIPIIYNIHTYSHIHPQSYTFICVRIQKYTEFNN